MLNNISVSDNETIFDYPIRDSNLPFTDYIARCRSIIEERRTDLTQADPVIAKRIIEANSPYELRPINPILSGKQIKYGALLVHGLLDCPFSLRDIGDHLQAKGILCRSILLPGHGTNPKDLISVSYHDWIQALRYGIENLRKEVEQIYLVGYSTGAALSIYQALQDTKIAGIILLAPAVKIKAPIDIVTGWHHLKKWLRYDNDQWLNQTKEIDYTKYLSVTFNAVTQVSMLTDAVKELYQTHAMPCPIFLVVSREDETISSHRAMDFFSQDRHPDSKLLLYTSIERPYPDPRIITRFACMPDQRINHLSHIAMPFSPNNSHYGKNGDYIYASRDDAENVMYGAYNRIEVKILHYLYQMKILKNKRLGLTYNPDFDFMTTQIEKFIFG